MNEWKVLYDNVLKKNGALPQMPSPTCLAAQHLLLRAMTVMCETMKGNNEV